VSGVSMKIYLLRHVQRILKCAL